MPDHERPQPELTDWPFTSYAAVIGILGLCNLLFAPIASMANAVSPPSIWPLYWGIGLLLSHVAVLPTWLVWTNGPFWRRLLRHWVSLVALVFMFVVGVFLVEGIHSQRAPASSIWLGYAVVLCCLPAVSLGAELPLWAGRVLLGWRIVPATHQTASDRPLTIVDTVIGLLSAGFAALSFGLLWLIDPGPSDVSVLGLTSLPALGILLGVVVVIPIGWSILNADDASSAFGLVVLSVSFAGSALFFAAESFGVRLPGGISQGIWLSMSCLVAVVGSFVMARSEGYRLARRKGTVNQNPRRRPSLLDDWRS